MKKVTPIIAGQLLGMNQQTVRNALQQERAPFGFAVKNPNNSRWTYHISPAKLISYIDGREYKNN